MATRTVPIPTQLFRIVFAPAALGALGALLAATASLLRVRTRQPIVPRMSDRWLQGLDRDSSRPPEHWH